MISIYTVTNRWGGIDIAWESLKKQTFRDFEWILVDTHYSERHREVREYVNDKRLRHFPTYPLRKEDFWDLNRSNNQALRLASGDIVISYQDYIWLPENAVEKFYAQAKFLGFGNWLTGCGHKGANPDKAYDPKGKISIFETPYSDPPSGFSEMDARVFGTKEPQIVGPTWFELNWACFWMKDIKEIGGFDERLDSLCYGCDNVSLADRAKAVGHDIWIDRSNEIYGFPHGKYFDRPSDWEENHGNKGAYNTDKLGYQTSPRLGFL